MENRGGDNVQATLKVRPFYSGRDFHSTQRENGSFNLAAEVRNERRSLSIL